MVGSVNVAALEQSVTPLRVGGERLEDAFHDLRPYDIRRWIGCRGVRDDRVGGLEALCVLIPFLSSRFLNVSPREGRALRS